MGSSINRSRAAVDVVYGETDMNANASLTAPSVPHDELRGYRVLRLIDDRGTVATFSLLAEEYRSKAGWRRRMCST